MRRSGELGALIEEAQALERDPRNASIRGVWNSLRPDKLPQAHGIPLSSAEVDQVPFTIDLEPDLWAALLDFDVDEYMTEARSFLANSLRMMIYRFRVFQDCTPIELTIPMNFGVILESSLFGAQPIFRKRQAPWIAREPLIEEYEDLRHLSAPDFYKSGIMPLVHRLYGELAELGGDVIKVVFPRWIRGPFGLATHLRGFENLLADFHLNPQFVRDLMRFLTDAQKGWVTERSGFCGSPIMPGILANDEVNCPSISAQLYEEFVLPFEVELADFYGGIGYWHSCGDTTKLISSIAKIPGLEVFHIGPWTDANTARETLTGGTAFEKCLHPLTDVYRATREQMEGTLSDIRRSLDGTCYTVRADGFQPMSDDPEEDVAAVKRWAMTAKEKLTNRRRT